MNQLQTESKALQSYPPRKEYDLIPKSGFEEVDRLELEAYVDYLAKYCAYTGIEDKPEQNDLGFNLKSFFGIYKFASGRALEITLDPRKISQEEKHQLLEEIIDWLAITGPNLHATLEMLNLCGIDESELSFSILLNELTSSLLKEYLPPALIVKRYISPSIFGKLRIPETIRSLGQGKPLFTSERVIMDIESLPVLFLIRMHYEMLSRLEKLISRIIGSITSKENENLDRVKISFALLREIRKNRAYHVEFISNPLYAHLLEKSLETDFDDPLILEKVRKEASTRKSLNDILHLWDAFKAKKVPRPQINDILRGGYSFKPASKLYELWTLKMLLDALSKITKQKWSASFKNGKAFFSFRDGHSVINLIYNSTNRKHHKFSKRFVLRPDFVVTLKRSTTHSLNEKVVLIADAKYKTGPKKSDLERMLAYLLTYCWKKPDEDATGLMLYIGTNDTVHEISGPYERVGPHAKLYSLCLRPNAESVSFAANHLRRIMSDLIH